ncbi:MerR family transcriptional regulator [Paenibacillus dakarensis]|uniref:MerR family transcriptional regulator n=1 Tax=Paenibacillus dakarensis TaxID=1527293 RepID=UPI0006D54B72|nr:MerR family transcriptional regulator [Paenibacillus dakarensis]
MQDVENLFKIGEFAKICGVSKQTLILYDRSGLFPPEYTDENGYRYYSFSQFDIIATIRSLKSIGLSLTEIKEFLNKRNVDLTYSLFNKQKNVIKNMITELNLIVNMMTVKCSLIEKARKVNLNMVYVEYHSEVYIKRSEKITSHASDSERYKVLGEHFQYRLAHQLHCGRAIGGIARVHKYKDQEKNSTLYKYYFSQIDRPEEMEEYVIKPAGNYLVLYHKGYYGESYKSYPILIEYAKRNDLILDDYAYEESLIDEVSEANPQNYVTQISIGFTAKNNTKMPG